MEGDACYRFSVIRDYIRQHAAPPVRSALDIGANRGDIALTMARYFPDARVLACEAVEGIFRELAQRVACEPRIRACHWAVTAAHRFEDDLRQRPTERPLCLLRARPSGGPGWRGGSIVASQDSAYDGDSYSCEPLTAEPKTLDEVLTHLLAETGQKEVDLAKFDAEGSEASAIGCAEQATLRRIRFLVGEYHNIDDFGPVVERILARTHRVRLSGEKRLGAFFAERRDMAPVTADLWAACH